MPYHIKTLSDDSLKTLWLVLEDLCKKSQLSQSSGNLIIDYFGIKEVSSDDHKIIIWGLQKDGHLKPFYGGYMLADSFVEFFNAVGDEMHDRIHKRIESENITTKKKVLSQDRLRFDENGSDLVINGVYVKVSLQKNYESKPAHKLLIFFLVKHKDDFFREFSYKEIANSPLFKDYGFPGNKISWRNYHDPLVEVNKKIIRKSELSKFSNFFQFDSSNDGKVWINPKHLETLGLAKPKLE